MMKRLFFYGIAMALIIGFLDFPALSYAHKTSKPHSVHRDKPHAAASSPPDNPQSWRSDPSLAAKLDAATEVGDYTVRPPLGYLFLKKQKDPFTFYFWTDTAHSNGSAPAFHILIQLSPADNHVPLETHIDLLKYASELEEDNRRKTEPDAIFSAPQISSINGLLFARNYWKGHDKQGVMRHGLSYEAMDDKAVIFAGGEDTEPYHLTSLPIMEAAILTFQKKQ